jgi:hypothetical protein
MILISLKAIKTKKFYKMSISSEKKTYLIDLILINLLIFGFFPIIPNSLKGLPIIFLLILSLYFFITENKKIINVRLFFTYSSIYLVYIFSLIYTSNMNYALNKLETGLSLIIFPVIFASIWKIREVIDVNKLSRKFIYIYFNSAFFYSCVVFLFLIKKGLFNYFNDPNFVRHFTETIPFIGQHSIYSSIFLGLGLIFSVKLLNLNHTLYFKIIIIIESTCMLLLLISLASKGVLIATMVSISVYCFFLLKTISKKIYVLLAISIIVILGVQYSPSLSKRIGFLDSGWDPFSYQEYLSSIQTRKAIYVCSVNVMEKNWVFGHGLGDVKDVLMGCYKDSSIYLVRGNYNSHNQYLSLLLGEGLFGLFVLLYVLFCSYKIAFIRQNFFYIAILIFYSIIMVIENILERQAGVILFYFLINLLSFLAIKNRKDLINVNS